MNFMGSLLFVVGVFAFLVFIATSVFTSAGFIPIPVNISIGIMIVGIGIGLGPFKDRG